MLELHRRFGKPQFYAVLLLLALMGQCVWLASRTPVNVLELGFISSGQAMQGHLEGESREFRSPLISWLATLPTQLPLQRDLDSAAWRVVLRLPFIFAGALLGASLWYVSRRLYGNAGGYVALTLYSFSAPLILRWSAISADPVAAWGTFGCIFTGIAVAHTLYAPREVVLWNWRRILLLGVSIGLAAAAVFATVLAVPVALAFMFYLVPHRRGAAVAILAAACAVAAFVVLVAFGFNLSSLSAMLNTSSQLQPTGAFAGQAVASALVDGFLMRNGPSFLTLAAVCIGLFLGWRRTRFFGTTAPLLVFVAFTVLALTLVHQHVLTFLWIALPFLMVFMAGVCADLLEGRSRWSGLISGLLLATLCSHALFSLMGLWHYTHQ
ncbi:MAG TPA: hypothetical protein VD837_04420 [Terriglobales bacterium]|nr:hypothetical protein [Terriglobales bacterium]